MDHRVIIFITGVFLLLIAASTVVKMLRRRNENRIDPSILNTCRSRIKAWWVFFGLLTCALLFGTVTTVIFFFLISFWALREYITLTPTRPADHMTLFWVFILWTPLQFLLVGVNSDWFANVFGISSYQVYSVLIPAYAFLLLPAWIAMTGDSTHFLERIAKLQVGLLICVYSLSFAPALLTMSLPNVRNDRPVISEVFSGGVEDKVIEPITQAIEGENQLTTEQGEGKKSLLNPQKEDEENQNPEETAEENTSPKDLPQEPVKEQKIRPRMTSDHLCLLFFFIFLVQMSDIFQYLWSQYFRRGVIAATINKNKTWGGVFAGAMTTALLGVGLWYFTPFPKWWQPLVTGFIISLMGFAGSITLSAIKRDRGVEGYGNLIEGHNGVLDRIDSLCFAAPVFFHLVWLFLHLEIKSFS